MRILQVTRQFHPSVGGIESVVWHLTQHLNVVGHRTDVISLNRTWNNPVPLPSDEVIEGIRIRRVPYWGRRCYAVAPQILKYVREYDLLHIHSSDFLLDYLAFSQPWHGKPLVLSSHGVFFHTSFARRLKSVYFHTITRLGLQRVSKIVCVSQQDLNLLAKVAPRHKLRLIHNGINYDELAELDRTRDPNLLLSVGRLASNKRYDRLLAAFALVVQRRPAARLVIIGPDWGEMKTLQRMAVSLNITNQVRLLGKVPRQQLLNHLGQASIWLTASEYEAFGVALLEAQAAGCVVIANQVPAFNQLLSDKRDGFLVDFMNMHATAETILQVLDMPAETRLQMTGRAQQRAAKFSWQTQALQFDELYKEVLSDYQSR